MSSGASHSWNQAAGDPPVPAVGGAPSPPSLADQGQVPTREQLQTFSDEYCRAVHPGWHIASPTAPNPTLVYAQVEVPAGACRLWLGPVDIALDQVWLQRFGVGHNVS